MSKVWSKSNKTLSNLYFATPNIIVLALSIMQYLNMRKVSVLVSLMLVEDLVDVVRGW